MDLLPDFDQRLPRRDILHLLAAAAVAAVALPAFTSKTMISRKIPASGEPLPVIGLGTWQTFDVGDNAAQREPLQKVLQMLAEKGGKVIDSSPMYGSSEQVVGDLVARQNLRERFFLATKVWTTGRETGIRQMQKSMQLMRAPIMDLMQIHNLIDWQTHLKTLRQWKDEGQIRYLGITHYHESAYGQLEKIMQQEKIDFVQLNYSIAEREAENRLLPLASEKGIAVLVNQPFDTGTLFKKTKGKELPYWASDYDISSWAQFFLKFIVAHPAVTCAIPGTSKPKHLLDNLAAGFGKMPDEAGRKKMVEFMKSL